MPKGVDPLANDPIKRARRNAIHTHNGFTGKVRWALTSMVDIQKASTATDESKRLSREIEIKLWELLDTLKTRKDI